jgi:hypothetical protein
MENVYGFVKLPELGELESLGLLFTLLPGLLTYLTVRVLSAREEKIEAVETVLCGLAYTLVVHALWVGLKALGSWIPTPDLIGLSLTAVGLGLCLAAIHNSGIGYRVLRRLHLTSESSWLTVWQTAFREFRGVQGGEYAVLHLKDGRRVMGAIRGFSPRQENGHVCLERVHWFSGTEESEEHPGLHLFNASDICVVEFLPDQKGASDARGQAESAAAATAARLGPENMVRPTQEGSTASSEAPATTPEQESVIDRPTRPLERTAEAAARRR